MRRFRSLGVRVPLQECICERNLNLLCWIWLRFVIIRWISNKNKKGKQASLVWACVSVPGSGCQSKQVSLCVMNLACNPPSVFGWHSARERRNKQSDPNRRPWKGQTERERDRWVPYVGVIRQHWLRSIVDGRNETNPSPPFYPLLLNPPPLDKQPSGQTVGCPWGRRRKMREGAGKAMGGGRWYQISLLLG